MNPFSKLTLVTVLLGQFAHAEIEIPSTVHPFSDLKKAQAQAALEHKPLVFVITDQATSCEVTTEASLVAFKTFKSLGVLVHFDHVKDRDSKVPIGFERIKNTAGVNLPFALVTTADGQTGVHAISAKAIHEDPRKAARAAKKKLAEIDVVGDVPAADDDVEDEPTVDDKNQATSKEKPKTKWNFGEWTNSDGKSIKAMPLEYDDEDVTFRMANGKSVSYPLKKLSEESREKLKAFFDSLE